MTALGFPAFSRTVTPGGGDKDGPGEINVPVSCGGAVVHPGDIVVGDRDGIAVVPRADAAEVLELVRALVKNEERRVAEIQSGKSSRRTSTRPSERRASSSDAVAADDAGTHAGARARAPRRRAADDPSSNAGVLGGARDHPRAAAAAVRHA